MAGINLGARLRKLFANEKISETFYEDLEDMLIEGDLGAKTALEMVDQIKKKAARQNIRNEAEFMAAIRETLSQNILVSDYVPDIENMNMVLVLGVNGVGKTTTIAKLAAFFRKEYNLESVLSAGDTFRAAAIDQLQYHGDNLNIRVVKQQHGSDPGAVIFDTIESAFSRGERMIIADTAGRMHNRENLIRELKKIDKIVNNRIDSDHYTKLLVIDATTGQNGLRQAEIFHEAVSLDGIILAKYDSGSKGGIVVSICRDLQLPVFFLGTGEGYDDISRFEKDDFLGNLLDFKKE